MNNWLTYLRITHPAIRAYSLIAPICLTVVFLVAYQFSPHKPLVWGEGSISNLIFSVSSLFPGFFLAALSAAATFGRDGIDDEISDKDTKYPLKIENVVVWEVPSKRQIAVFLFHFLLVLSVFLTVISGTATFAIHESVLTGYWDSLSSIINLCGLAILLFLSLMLLSVLVQGVEFFVTRLMRND